jgi:serine protease Do
MKLFLSIMAVLGLVACRTPQGDEDSKAVNAKLSQTARTASNGIDDSRHNALTRAIEAVSPAVVGINVTELREQPIQDPFWGMFFGNRMYQDYVQELGSGFIISSDGYVVTNDHVSGNAVKIVVTMTNGEKVPAKLIGTDRTTDVCLIKLEGKTDLPYLKLGNSDDVIVGEWSIAFGNPFGLFSASAKPTVTVGVISATRMDLDQKEDRIYRNMVQTDAAINGGNSGGPLVNSLGEVIGMNTLIYTQNQGNVGLGFAIPINKVKEIVDILKRDGKVDRNIWPGFRVQQVNNAIAHAYNLEKAEGVIVTDIDRRGSAAHAGLEVADIILRANNEPVLTIQTLQALVSYAKRGDVIMLEVVRNKKTMAIELEMMPR